MTTIIAYIGNPDNQESSCHNQNNPTTTKINQNLNKNNTITYDAFLYLVYKLNFSGMQR